jgi:hypothetical protein
MVESRGRHAETKPIGERAPSLSRLTVEGTVAWGLAENEMWIFEIGDTPPVRAIDDSPPKEPCNRISVQEEFLRWLQLAPLCRYLRQLRPIITLLLSYDVAAGVTRVLLRRSVGPEADGGAGPSI